MPVQTPQQDQSSIPPSQDQNNKQIQPQEQITQQQTQDQQNQENSQQTPQTPDGEQQDQTIQPQVPTKSFPLIRVIASSKE
jgi:hypothetical protein